MNRRSSTAGVRRLRTGPTLSDDSRLMPAARRWTALSLAYGVVCATLIGALVAELVLALERRAARRAVRDYAEANVFEQAREIAEGGGQGIWLRPSVSYRPGATLELKAGGQRYEIRINSLGFRCREFSERKPQGAFRVLCIGGSTTVQGRTNEETYPALLERKLRLRYPSRNVEVLNLGINGTSSGHWLTRLDSLFRFEPDAILHYEFVNDLFFDHLERYAAEHPWRRAIGRSLLLSRLLPLDPAELDPYFLATLRKFRRMERESSAHAAAYVLGCFAGPDPASAAPVFRDYLDLNVESWGAPLRLRYYRDYHGLLRRYDERFQAFVEENHMAGVRVDRQISDPALFVDLCHMTPVGIERLADAFLPAVSALLEGGKAEHGQPAS